MCLSKKEEGGKGQVMVVVQVVCSLDHLEGFFYFLLKGFFKKPFFPFLLFIS